MNDNVMDPFHVQVLHSTFSGIQFHQALALMPKVDFFYADHGVCYSAVRELEDGSEVDRISCWLMPNIMSVPDIRMRIGRSSGVSWVVPVDDSHYLQAMVMKLPQDTPRFGIQINGKCWGEMTEEEHQRFPGDFEAQAGQGPISLHSEEHLVTQRSRHHDAAAPARAADGRGGPRGRSGGGHLRSRRRRWSKSVRGISSAAPRRA